MLRPTLWMKNVMQDYNVLVYRATARENRTGDFSMPTVEESNDAAARDWAEKMKSLKSQRTPMERREVLARGRANAKLSRLFAKLDQRHYDGRLSAAGYRTQFATLIGKSGQCLCPQLLIQIDPEQVEPGEVRQVLLHEMVHAACNLDEPECVPHRARFKREITRLFTNGEPCLAVDHAIITQIHRGLLPCGAAARAALVRRVARLKSKRAKDEHRKNSQ